MVSPNLPAPEQNPSLFDASHRRETPPQVAEDGCPRVAIVGLGLIGGSLARRLATRGLPVIAWNHRPHPYEAAERDGIHCVGSLAELVTANPDIIILCNPLKAMPAVLAELTPALADHPGITLTDVGSVKGMVREQVEAAGLGERYVGAHPMAGNEHSGWTAADPTLFDGALWALSVDETTSYDRFLAVARLITRSVGNEIIVLDDATHDRAAALISHMPHVVATALINELVASQDRSIAAALAAGSWRDMTRVALTDPQRTRAMVEEDAANVAGLLRSVAARLEAMAMTLEGVSTDTPDTDAALAEFFAEGQAFRDYKARGDLAGERETLVVPETGWQAALLASARRGERIVQLQGDREMLIRTRGL